MNIDGILRSLDEPSNEHLLQFTSQKIRELNHRVLLELALGSAATSQLMEKLDSYKYIDRVEDLKYGAYVRWIRLEDPEHLELSNGALFCEVKQGRVEPMVVLRSPNRRHFQIPLERCLLFQKLSPQEQLILSALDHLAVEEEDDEEEDEEDEDEDDDA